MGSVAQAVESIALYAKEPKPRVKQIARHLIDNGVLPKSEGRRPAQINETDLAALLIAVCAAPVTADAQRCVLTWGSMTPGGGPLKTDPEEKLQTLLGMLAFLIRGIWEDGGNGSHTALVLVCRLEINATRPHALFTLAGDRYEFLPVGAEKEYSGIQRVVHIPGAALVRIALSVHTGLHYGPAIPLGPRAAEGGEALPQSTGIEHAQNR